MVPTSGFSGTTTAPLPRVDGAGSQRAGHGGRAPASRPWAWILGVLLAGGLIWLVFAVFVGTSTGQVTEYVALEAATERLETLGWLAEGVLRLLPTATAVIAVVVFALVTVWRRRWLASAIALASAAGANLTTQLLKSVLLVRPDFENGVPYYTGNSLPSGHTTFAAAAAVAVLLVVGPRWRPLAAVLGALFATAVGTGTFIETWHRPSDMAAAYLVAAAWGLVGGYLVLRTGPEWNTWPRTGPGRIPAGRGGEALLWTAGLALTVGGVVCFALAGGLEALDPDQPGSSGWHYLGGLLFSSGPGLLVFAALAGFLRAETGTYLPRSSR